MNTGSDNTNKDNFNQNENNYELNTNIIDDEQDKKMKSEVQFKDETEFKDEIEIQNIDDKISQMDFISEEQIMRIIDALRLDEVIELDEIPNLDLYMDQVITLFEDKLIHTKRYQEDKLLTKTMINNYTKDRLLMPAKKKKYTKEHILLMILLYELKQILSIGDIKELFNIIIIDGEVATDKLEVIYEIYLSLRKSSISDFKKEVKTMNNHINNKIKEAYTNKFDQAKEVPEQMDTLLQEVRKSEDMLTAVMLIQKANYYKKLAEKIIDNKLK